MICVWMHSPEWIIQLVEFLLGVQDGAKERDTALRDAGEPLYPGVQRRVNGPRDSAGRYRHSVNRHAEALVRNVGLPNMLVMVRVYQRRDLPVRWPSLKDTRISLCTKSNIRL